MSENRRHWAQDAFFYHIYPLGFCGAPYTNDMQAPVTPRLEKLYAWIDHLAALGVNAVYIGPLFESSTHGYDTADYFTVDRRLGTNEQLKKLIEALHARGIRVILDAVFNHTGRDFWAFREFLKDPYNSMYRDWFSGVDFNKRSPFNDPFTYSTWHGHYSLVKLNLLHSSVQEHLLKAVESWVRTFDIDGLRLDAADCLHIEFLKILSAHCRELKLDFWLMGEIIHGDYRTWACNGILDSVTNYECYKGLYSSHNDRNFHEIGYSLNRQFGEKGIYKDIPLYNFVDNHDVNRVASTLHDAGHLFTLYALLFTMPGVPSIYYGSEWGITGKKQGYSDAPLRPCIELDALQATGNEPLKQAIARFAKLRRDLPALRHGSYRHLLVAPEQMIFCREADGQKVIVAINAAKTPASITFPVPFARSGTLADILNNNEPFTIEKSRTCISVPARWARVLSVR